MSRQEELAGLLALEARREEIECGHLAFVQGAYQQGTTAYLSAQKHIEELASQSALRRQEIERGVNQQIYADYRRSFEQIGSTVSGSVMGLIEEHLTLGQAAKRVALSIIQSFIQAKVKMVADWLAGVATMTMATTAGQTAQTAAVAAGAAARSATAATGAATINTAGIAVAMKNIMTSAAETFAGIFGFLAPVMGPAAAGPAAAGEATVMAATGGLASFAVGAWSLPSDMIAQVHQGEMIIPAGPAGAFRSMMQDGGVAGNVHVHHATNFNISAMDSRGVKQFFNDHGKTIVRALNEGVRTGSHLGLSKLGKA